MLAQPHAGLLAFPGLPQIAALGGQIATEQLVQLLTLKASEQGADTKGCEVGKCWLVSSHSL